MNKTFRGWLGSYTTATYEWNSVGENIRRLLQIFKIHESFPLYMYHRIWSARLVASLPTWQQAWYCGKGMRLDLHTGRQDNILGKWYCGQGRDYVWVVKRTYYKNDIVVKYGSSVRHATKMLLLSRHKIRLMHGLSRRHTTKMIL